MSNPPPAPFQKGKFERYETIFGMAFLGYVSSILRGAAKAMHDVFHGYFSEYMQYVFGEASSFKEGKL